MSARIVDASVAIKWVVAESGTGEALALFSHRLLAPVLWRAEVANVLWKKVKRGELLGEEAEVGARLLDRSPVELCSPNPLLADVLKLALALDHPAYDCVYLALAKARRIPLVTADEKLIRIVRSCSQQGGLLEGIVVQPLMNSPAAN